MRIITLLLCFLSFSGIAQEFKIIGYYMPTSEKVNFDHYTHINYSFAIPAPSGDTLLPLRNPERVMELVKDLHKQGKKVFISVGGWGIGDAPGDDTRFHKMAETEKGRRTFINSTLNLVKTYGFDGVDLDWEYPDEDSPSADQYVELVKGLHTALHKENKELTAAVISYGRKGYGIKNEAFNYLDWINLMAYDDDYGSEEIKAHSPYALAQKSIDYWLKERKLPAHKAVLGLPYYSKKGHGQYGPSYKDLLKDGASPYDDYWKGAFYNGIFTIQNKTRLAKDLGLAGVMVWEIRHDTSDEYSLVRAIYQASK